jgi:ribose transport system substrate-binding protein
VTPGAKCILGANPPYLSAEALRLAVAVLDGQKPASQNVLVRTPLLTNDTAAAIPGTVAIVTGQTAFPNQPPGLSLPISPDWVRITPAEATGQ